MYEVEEKPKTGIDPVGRYCRHCQDRYYNFNDVDSIRKHKVCVFCIKELDEFKDLK